jgi:hypothetical protein
VIHRGLFPSAKTHGQEDADRGYPLARETNLEWMERVYLKMDETTVREEERVEVA